MGIEFVICASENEKIHGGQEEGQKYALAAAQWSGHGRQREQ